MSELVYTPGELAEQLGCDVRIIIRLTDEGRIPAVRLSARKVVHPKRQIDEWLAAEADASTVLFELEADGVDVPGMSGRRRAGAA